MADPLLVNRHGSVTVLTLNRPEHLNTLSPHLIDRLAKEVEHLRTDETVRAVVLTGSGRAFCAGVEVGNQEYDPLSARSFLKNLNRIFDDLEHLPQPTLAALNGPAVAGGLELALACTMRIAASDTHVALPEIRLGLVAAVGTTYRLPRLVGFGRALEMALLGDPIDAPTALDWGLVNRVVPREDVVGVAMDLAERLAAGPPVAIGLVKDAFYAATAGPSATSLIEVLSASVNHFTHDKVEGLTAFFEKRPPRFEGK